jgi:iron complex transport system substrate-binding protein
MACALGLGDELMGITHECDYPPEIRGKPIVVRNVLPVEEMNQREIDTAITERLRNGLSLYQVVNVARHLCWRESSDESNWTYKGS